MDTAHDLPETQRHIPMMIPPSNPADAMTYAAGTLILARLKTLSADDLRDLAELTPAFAKCESHEEMDEITKAVWEILCPELLGGIQEIPAGSVKPSPTLQKRIDWIANRIKVERKERGWTQAELAEKSNLLQSHISRLEAGHHSPAHKTLEKLAEAFGIAIGDLDPAEE